MTKTYKTFYSVDFATIGADNVMTKWFDNLTDAKAFSNQDYHDNVVKHTFSNPISIANIEDIICEQNRPLWY